MATKTASRVSTKRVYGRLYNDNKANIQGNGGFAEQVYAIALRESLAENPDHRLRLRTIKIPRELCWLLENV